MLLCRLHLKYRDVLESTLLCWAIQSWSLYLLRNLIWLCGRSQNCMRLCFEEEFPFFFCTNLLAGFHFNKRVFLFQQTVFIVHNKKRFGGRRAKLSCWIIYFLVNPFSRVFAHSWCFHGDGVLCRCGHTPIYIGTLLNFTPLRCSQLHREVEMSNYVSNSDCHGNYFFLSSVVPSGWVVLCSRNILSPYRKLELSCALLKGIRYKFIHTMSCARNRTLTYTPGHVHSHPPPPHTHTLTHKHAHTHTHTHTHSLSLSLSLSLSDRAKLAM